MGKHRPGWQVDDCPSWCDRAHRDADHDDDRTHTSAGLLVPAIRRRMRRAGEGPSHVVEAVEMMITFGRADGDIDTWVHIGDDGDDPLELSAESAHRLHRLLGSALRELSAGADRRDGLPPPIS